MRLVGNEIIKLKYKTLDFITQNPHNAAFEYEHSFFKTRDAERWNQI